MTGDRRLTEREKYQEITSHSIDALKIIKESGGEPSLFELAIIELSAKIEAHTKLIIELGAEVEALKGVEAKG